MNTTKLSTILSRMDRYRSLYKTEEQEIWAAPIKPVAKAMEVIHVYFDDTEKFQLFTEVEVVTPVCVVVTTSLVVFVVTTAVPVVVTVELSL